jgi:hypothetical protein
MSCVYEYGLANFEAVLHTKLCQDNTVWYKTVVVTHSLFIHWQFCLNTSESNEHSRVLFHTYYVNRPEDKDNPVVDLYDLNWRIKDSYVSSN